MWWDKLIWVIQSRLEISFIIQHFALALSIVIVGYNIKLTQKSILCGGGFSLIFTTAMLLMSLIYFTFGTQGFIIFLDGMFAIISAIFIFFRNKYRRDTKYYLWLELFGIMVTITQIIGQLSFLGSHFNVSDGVLWALRSFGSVLIVPCSVFITYIYALMHECAMSLIGNLEARCHIKNQAHKGRMFEVACAMLKEKIIWTRLFRN